MVYQRYITFQHGTHLNYDVFFEQTKCFMAEVYSNGEMDRSSQTLFLI